MTELQRIIKQMEKRGFAISVSGNACLLRKGEYQVYGEAESPEAAFGCALGRWQQGHKAYAELTKWVKWEAKTTGRSIDKVWKKYEA